MSEQIGEGDMESMERGTAGRMNTGKVPMELIPVRVWHGWWEKEFQLSSQHPAMDSLLTELVRWQEKCDSSRIFNALSDFPIGAQDDIARVLEFGAQKYKAWNWAKGQRWGCTLGSLLRHCRKILQGEMNDSDSGLPHWGHIGCNLVFLVWFQDHYKDGDDRPPIYNDEGELV